MTEHQLVEAERARLVHDLCQEQARLKDIVATVPGIVWQHVQDSDSEHISSFVSDYVKTLVGYTADEWLANPDFWMSILHADDRNRVISEHRALLRKGGGGSGVFRWIAKDGRTVWVQAQVRVIPGSDGKPIGMRGVTIDITEQKLAEQRLIEAERTASESLQFADRIIASSPVGIATYDTVSGQCVSCNDALATIVGTTLEEVSQQNFRRLESWKTSGLLQLAEAALASAKSVRGDFHLITSFGKEVWVDCTFVPFSFKARPLLLLMFNDNTEQKRLQAQFIQAQKMEAVGRLAAGVAHDVNNMLTIVNGYCDVLIEDLGDPASARMKLEEVKKAGARSANLVRQLLTFSRKQVTQPRVLNLNEVVTDVERWMRRLIGEDIELKTALCPELGYTRIDLGHIEQVLMNLTINARDAMPEGGKLTIETHNVEATQDDFGFQTSGRPGPYVMLAVSDNGIGMDAETQSKIFEPFFTTKEAGKGTGLGLSTVFGIIEQAGGVIRVYSEPGKGTTFRVLLRRVDEPAVTASVSDSSSPERGEETILVVEDDSAVRNLVHHLLESYGYSVLDAGNAMEAIHICNEYASEIHLMLTDLIMPGGSGSELAPKIAASRPGMKLLFMSGYTEDALIHRGVIEGEIAFIPKPFGAAELAKRIRTVLQSH